MNEPPALPTPANRVPTVTWSFWLLKVLCTTVGETAADFLNEDLGFGLAGTTLAMSVLWLIALWLQFRAGRYMPSIYWLVVVTISVVGTLITDNLTDHLGVPLELSTIVFAGALAATFVTWYVREETLSIRTIVTPSRELFYWTAVLFTFALGTALGDLLSEDLELGYLVSGLLFGGVILAVAIAYRWSRVSAVAAFWVAYIVTRPLGASLGDYLAQDPDKGGLGLGSTLTSGLFVASIVALIAYLSISKRDALTTPEPSVHQM